MADNHQSTPEETDAQYQPLLQHLHDIYQSGKADNQSLARIRARLLQQNTASFEGAASTTNKQDFQQFTNVISSQERRSMPTVSSEPVTKASTAWQRRINLLAAVVIVGLLVGSLLLLLTHARQNSIGSGKPTAILPIETAITALPTTVITLPGPGWKVFAQYSGMGSMTKSNLHIVLPRTWSAIFVCGGTGGMTILFNDSTNFRDGFSACDYVNHAADVVDIATPPIHTVQVIVDKQTQWQLVIAGCTRNTPAACGMALPTPTPTISTPTPTPTGVVTPTPMPTYTPTPTPMPTDIPTPTPMPTSIPSPTPTPMP